MKLLVIINIATLWQDKQELGRAIANDLSKLNHKNLLNIEEINNLDTNIQGGFLKFTTECPDHIS